MKPSADESRQTALLVVHGLSEYGARYSEMAEALHRRGIDVHLWDLPGHGSRKGERPGDAVWFPTFLRETAARLDQLRASHDRVTLFGHSMGGTVVLRYMQEYGTDGIDRIIVASPFLKPSGPLQRGLFGGTSAIAKLAPFFSVPGRNLAGALTSDRDKQAEYREDREILDHVPFGLFRELGAAGASLTLAKFTSFDKTLFCYGEQDKVCLPRHLLDFLRKNDVPNSQLRQWPTARHELAQETIRDDFFKEVAAWTLGGTDCAPEPYPAKTRFSKIL